MPKHLPRRGLASAVLSLLAGAAAAGVPLPEDMLAAGAAALAQEVPDAEAAKAAALAAFTAMAAHQWQPIATAPKDRQVLLGRADAGGFRLAVGGWEVHDDPPFDGGRWSATVWWGAPPTHWMDIPAPPR